MKRFEISVPALVKMKAGVLEGKRIEVTSRNICAGGAYFVAPETVKVGTPVEVKMAIGSKIGDHAFERSARVVVAGEILRHEFDGWVVKFNKHFKMTRR
jgi:hypothetical protein